MSDEAPKLPPKRISLGDIPQYVRTKHYTDVSRKTVYNWVHKGVRGEKLRVTSVGPRMFTTKEWVDAFLANTSRV